MLSFIVLFFCLFLLLLFFAAFVVVIVWLVCLFVCFVLFFVFNSKTILKFHSLFYVSWNDSRDRIVVSTLRCGRNNPGSNPGHGTHKTVFFLHLLFLPLILFPPPVNVLIVSSFSFGAFEECWYFVSKWYEIQWLLKITTACRVCDLTMSI